MLTSIVIKVAGSLSVRSDCRHAGFGPFVGAMTSTAGRRVRARISSALDELHLDVR